MVPTSHISRHYDEQLDQVKQLLLEMGGRIEEMISDATRALVERDTELADQVRGRDATIDRLEKEVDEHCIGILALRQPAAIDLRFIAAAIKIVTDLERIGDEVVNICERASELNREPQLKPYLDLPRMAELAKSMVSDSLDCLLRSDAIRAKEILKRDEQVDDLNEQIFRELLAMMLEDTSRIRRATALIFVAKYLERIADHATNVAEMVIYMVEGRDVRHGGTA